MLKAPTTLLDNNGVEIEFFPPRLEMTTPSVGLTICTEKSKIIIFWNNLIFQLVCIESKKPERKPKWTDHQYPMNPLHDEWSHIF